MTLATTDTALDAFVGRRVYMIMWDRRLTQLELGRRIGMDQSALGKRLRGERGWTLDQIRDVATALETTIAYLVGEVGDPSVHPLGLEPRTHWFRADEDVVIPIEWAFELRQAKLDELQAAA